MAEALNPPLLALKMWKEGGEPRSVFWFPRASVSNQKVGGGGQKSKIKNHIPAKDSGRGF